MKKPILLAIMGHPVGHSLSPKIFEYLGKKFKKNIDYQKINVLPFDLEKAMIAAKVFAIRGLNFTVPHKELVLRLVDVVSDEVREIGAANVVHLNRGKWVAYNTDFDGVLETFRIHKILPKRGSVLVLGAGGASRAVCYTLAKMKAKEIYIWNRTQEKAEVMIQELRVFFPKTKYINFSTLEVSKLKCSIWINTTTVGMKGVKGKLPIPRESAKFAFDVIYRPEETPFLKNAKKRKIKTANGLDMLVGQALSAFAIWFKEVPNRSKVHLEIKKMLLKELKSEA